MNKIILFIVLSTLISCGKQSKESKDAADQQATKQDTTPATPIDKYYPIPMDTKFASRLSKKESKSIFTRRRENQLGISNPVYQVYSYNDESGEYFLLLTDHMKAVNEEKDTLYDNIYAVYVTKKNNQFKKRSTVQDEIDNDWETSIGFWNKYSELSDLDNDGLVDPILVYGTRGQNAYKDGRVKIMVYYRGKRMSIKHQNSEIEDGRLTKINKNFYGLPTQIQEAVKEKMRQMVTNKHAIFSAEWEKKMANRAIRLEGK
ncbi:M949_RS01915 family surface polysaccharide biosynthesis protein [Aquimarina celericrescens]|uniref:M949_RS01915 family surface polysaccharide biosynthesis protein n=1 Tax=Aquimarina celericrescens TaxID=1964542 RepID=A0ABW5AZT2_9FLAO|nr:hypothetical protein [Aquimarina celericrescens]